MAHWSADGREVSEELRAALAPGGPLPPGPAEAHVHIRAGIGSLLGDTHVVLGGSRLRIVGRRTSLDPLTEVVLAGRPRLDDSGYRPVLLLPTTEGEQRVEVTSLEEAAVEDLLATLPPVSLGGAAAPGEALPDLATARAALLGALGRRMKQRRAGLVAQRYTRRSAFVDHKLRIHRAQTDASDERWRARHGRASRRADRKAETGSPGPRSVTALLLRFLLVIVAGAVAFGLFALVGRAFASRP